MINRNAGIKPTNEKLDRDAEDFFENIGSRGGSNTLKRYGKEHYAEIARKSHESRRENKERYKNELKQIAKAERRAAGVRKRAATRRQVAIYGPSPNAKPKPLKKKTGRPPGDPKSLMLWCRVTPKLFERVKAAASPKQVSTWLRELVERNLAA